MANVINLQPQVLNLELYAGDGVEFRLVCTDVNGAPIDVNGTVIAQVKLERLDSTSLATFTVGLVDAYQGIVILSLTGAQTAALVADSPAGKFVGVWDIQWTPSGKQPRTLCQGTVECVTDVTR
jgi:hypothetical protein